MMPDDEEQSVFWSGQIRALLANLHKDEVSKR